MSIIRNDHFYLCTVYSAIPPCFEELFSHTCGNEEKTEYHLQIDERFCSVFVRPYYTCSFLYFMVQTLLRIEMIIKEDDDFELYIGDRRIENTDILIVDLMYNSNELTMKIIPKEKKKRFVRCTVTNVKNSRIFLIRQIILSSIFVRFCIPFYL